MLVIVCTPILYFILYSVFCLFCFANKFLPFMIRGIEDTCCYQIHHHPIPFPPVFPPVLPPMIRGIEDTCCYQIHHHPIPFPPVFPPVIFDSHPTFLEQSCHV